MVNRIFIVTAITSVMLCSVNVQAQQTQYQIQKSIVDQTNDLLTKADNLLAKKDIPGLQATLQQALDKINTFKGKSGQMPPEIAQVAQSIDISIKTLNEWKKNPHQFKPGQVSTSVALLIKSSQNTLEDPILLPL